jgi:hypothetical protein
MRKTFGSAFALVMVALFTVAPTSPAAAYPGGIHLHIAGKVGQKAVGSTIIFGAEGLTKAPQASSGFTPNSCLIIEQLPGSNGNPTKSLEPAVSGWTQCTNTLFFYSESGKSFQIPASGSFADQVPLPALPAGDYAVEFGALVNGGNSAALTVTFTIGADGTFTAFGPVKPQ